MHVLREKLRVLLQEVQVHGPVKAEGVTVLPGQFREHGSAPESHPQAVGEGAYVGAGTAFDPKTDSRKFHGENLRLRNFHTLCFFRDVLSAAGQAVKRPAVVLGSGIGGNGLHVGARPGSDVTPYGIRAYPVPAVFGENGSLSVPGVRFPAELESAAVNLGASAEQVAGEFGALSEKDKQDTAGHGIQRARVTDLFLAHTLDGRDAAVGGRP